jgi:lipopolysaccharide biosynthesis protein
MSEISPSADNELDIAVHMHVYFIDLLPELAFQTQNIDQPFTCYVTTDLEEKAEAIKALLSKHPLITTFEVIVTPNRGRDIAPWIIEMARYNNHHELWCHIHTKKSLHVPKLGDSWRRFLLQQILGSKRQVRNIVSSFNHEHDLGLVIPPFYKPAVGRVFRKWDEPDRAKIFFKTLKISSLPPRNPTFAAGSMFWYRPKALSTLFDQSYSYDDFELETNQLGGTLAHLVERSLAYIATNNAFSFKVVMPVYRLDTL